MDGLSPRNASLISEVMSPPTLLLEDILLGSNRIPASYGASHLHLNCRKEVGMVEAARTEANTPTGLRG